MTAIICEKKIIKTNDIYLKGFWPPEAKVVLDSGVSQQVDFPIELP